VVFTQFHTSIFVTGYKQFPYKPLLSPELLVESLGIVIALLKKKQNIFE